MPTPCTPQPSWFNPPKSLDSPTSPDSPSPLECLTPRTPSLLNPETTEAVGSQASPALWNSQPLGFCPGGVCGFLVQQDPCPLDHTALWLILGHGSWIFNSSGTLALPL